MTLCSTREHLKFVPWVSLTEWHNVYKQIYSNSHQEQEIGYKTLLVWKARKSKLPVGVDCTLSLMQVSLRDREWTQKLDKAELPVYYESDLCMMYSTAIMRFMNQISNIGHTKQTSLFQIAKQLKIPEWIVNLRHDAAHGQELPSIDVLRIASIILLTWLHDEYWVAEIQTMLDYYDKEIEIVENNESDEVHTVKDLIELWTATGLYIHANYSLVSDVPDHDLQRNLIGFCTFTLNQSQHNVEYFMDAETKSMAEKFKNNEQYRLITILSILLSEISKYLSKNKFLVNNTETICTMLCDNEIFLPSPDILRIFMNGTSRMKTIAELPINFIKFWQGVIILLQEKKLLKSLFIHLLKLVNNCKENEHKRLVASLWIRSIVDALTKQKITQQVALDLEQILDHKKNKLSSKHFSLKVRNKVDKLYPGFEVLLDLNWTADIPISINDLTLVQKLFLHPNEFLLQFIPSLLHFVLLGNSSEVTEDFDIQKHLLTLLRIEIIHQDDRDTKLKDSVIHNVEHLTDFILQKKKKRLESVHFENMNDKIIRNPNWQLASVTHTWSTCPLGLLPWQMDFKQTVQSLIIAPSKIYAGASLTKISPGVIDHRNLKMKSEINWKNVIIRKSLKKRRRKECSDILVDRAIKIIKSSY